MPTESVDEFGASFAEALQAAGDLFPGPSADLVERGISRGRRMGRARAVRTSVVAVSFVLIVAGAALAGTHVFGGGTAQTAATPTPPAKASASATPSPSAAAGISDRSMISTLEGLLPSGGTFSDAQGRGTEPLPGGGAAPSASAVYHGSGGVSGVEVALSRVTEGTPVTSTDYSSCPSAIDNPYAVCSTRTQPDGSLLVVDKDFTRPQADTGQRSWSVVLIRTDGAIIQVSEFGAGAEKSTTNSADPVLSTDLLTAIARSAAWQPALALIEPPAPATTSPSAMAQANVMSILTSLLPHGVAISDQSGQDGFAELVFDDGHGKTALEVNVQDMPGLSMDCASRTQPGTTCSATTLPDGTQQVITQTLPSNGTGSVTQWQVDTLRPNGLRVVVVEFNAASSSGPVTRATPGLTVTQLEQLATSASWEQ